MTDQALKLRRFREERGWTQRDVAEKLQRLAWIRYDDHAGVNADMVAKWERGAKGVSPYYRELLALLYGVDARALGLGVTTGLEDAGEQLRGRAQEVIDLLERLGPHAAALRPGVLRALQDQVVRRRALLDVMGLLSMDADEGDAPLEGVDFDDLADRHQELYHAIDPAVLLSPVVAQYELAGAAVGTSTTAAGQRRLLAARARAAVLAGRLNFFDLNDALAARGYYSAGLEAARECADHHQATSALAHLSFVPAAEGAAGAALDYLEAAHRELTDSPCPPITSWLAAIASELHANAGDHDAARRALAQAEEALASDRGAVIPIWFDFYDRTRLAGFAGYAHLRAGRFDDARAALDEALRLPLAAAKQRAVLQADLATVHFHAGDLDEACRAASIAVDDLTRAGYATGTDRIRAFLALVRPHAASPAVRHLDERVSSLH